MTDTRQNVTDLDVMVTSTLIRDLVEQHPETMPVLGQYGIDTCCGGGLTVAAAAEAHGHDPAQLVEHVLRAIRGEGA